MKRFHTVDKIKNNVMYQLMVIPKKFSFEIDEGKVW